MSHYVCHVRLKGGEYEAGADFYRGDIPRAGEVIQIVACGETLKGRVGFVIVPQRKPHGDPVVHIVVDQV
jgi:hypothetical protein